MRAPLLLIPMLLVACTQGQHSFKLPVDESRYDLTELMSGGDASDPDRPTCEQLAAHPADPDRLSEGVADESLNVERALEVCEREAGTNPSPRTSAHLGRTLFVGGLFEEAIPFLLVAAEYGSGLALFYLAVATDMDLFGNDDGQRLSPTERSETLRELLALSAETGFAPAMKALSERDSGRLEETPGGIPTTMPAAGGLNLRRSELDRRPVIPHSGSMPQEERPQLSMAELSLRREGFLDAFSRRAFGDLDRRGEEVLHYLSGMHSFLTEQAIFYPECVGKMENITPNLIQIKLKTAVVKKLRSADSGGAELPGEAKALLDELLKSGAVPSGVAKSLRKLPSLIPQEARGAAMSLAESAAISTLSAPVLQQDGRDDALTLATKLGCESAQAERVYQGIRSYLKR